MKSSFCSPDWTLLQDPTLPGLHILEPSSGVPSSEKASPLMLLMVYFHSTFLLPLLLLNLWSIDHQHRISWDEYKCRLLVPFPIYWTRIYIFKTQKCISALPFQKQWYNMFPFHSAINCIYVWFSREWKLLNQVFVHLNYQSGCLFLTSVLLQLLLSWAVDWILPKFIKLPCTTFIPHSLEVWIFYLITKIKFLLPFSIW